LYNQLVQRLSQHFDIFDQSEGLLRPRPNFLSQFPLMQ